MYSPYKQEELVVKEIEDFWPGVIAYGFPVYINGSTGLRKTNVFLKVGADATRGVFPPGVKDGALEEPIKGASIKMFYVSTENPVCEIVYPALLYGQRTGSWEFRLRPGRRWASVYSEIMNFLHGERHTVILEDNPGFQYVGRLSVNQWRSDPSQSLITIDYNLDPFKYSTESSDESDWLWNDLFVDNIRYGRFDVSGTKHRNFINSGLKVAIPTFDCSAPMSVLFNRQTFNLVAGKNYNANLSLQPGDNIMVFTGNGTVRVSYREVSL